MKGTTDELRSSPWIVAPLSDVNIKNNAIPFQVADTDNTEQGLSLSVIFVLKHYRPTAFREMRGISEMLAICRYR